MQSAYCILEWYSKLSLRYVWRKTGGKAAERGAFSGPFRFVVPEYQAVSRGKKDASFSGSMFPPERKKQIFSPGLTLKAP